MSTTANALYLPVGGHLVPLDLDADTALLPTFQANDRTKPESIQSDYSPEFSVPGTAHNHRLLRHAAASQPAAGQAYARLPCVLTSGGVEILPLGLLYVKGYQEGKYQLQLAGGNRRLVEALGDKKLADLNLSRFDHDWTAANVLAGLPFDHWQTQGWGYEVYERGKPLDSQKLDPFTLYPSCSGQLVWQQILTDAGFTADSVLGEPLFTQLNAPAANPYAYGQDFRDARQLTAGYFYQGGAGGAVNNYSHGGGFAQERLVFGYTSRKPYHFPDSGTASYGFGLFTADTLGYYDIAASIPTFFGCNDRLPGKVRVKFMLLVNGQHLFDASGAELGKDEAESGKYITQTFSPKLSRYLLRKDDRVELVWQGDEIGSFGPDQPHWAIGPYGSQTDLGGGLLLATEVQLTVTLLADFPPGGRVRLAQWLPDMKQLDFVKTYMLLGGMTVQADAYEPHLRLATGDKLLANAPAAKDWTRKRDAFAQPGRLPERNLAYRFGEYGQRNYLKWLQDEAVTAGYGDGLLPVADQVLPAEYELATLPFAASQPSPQVTGMLRILNFEVADFTASPATYNSVEAKPRLTLRSADRLLSGQLITKPQVGKPGDSNYVPAVLTAFTTTLSYFASTDVSLLLNSTVLGTYWSDLRALLDQSRYLVERYRLTPQDVAELDYSVPIWDGLLGDYFAVSQVGEYDARRPVEVYLCRLNANYLPAPKVPGGGVEFWEEEFYSAEFY